MNSDRVIPVLVVFLVVVSHVCEGTQHDPCTLFKDCSCFEYKEYEIQCPSSSEVDVIIEFLPDKYIQIDCQNIKQYKFDIIANVSIEVESLTVKWCQLPLPKFQSVLEKFNITHLKHLKLEGCVLGNNYVSQIEINLFEGLSFLESLTINSVSITLTNEMFENLPNLKELSLEDNNLTEIGYFFEKNPRLEVLDLSKNFINSLPDGIFRNLPELQLLYLWKNEITSIQQNYLTGLPKLKYLGLSMNAISFLHEDAFSGLPELIHISLRRNKLGRLGPNIFEHNKNIETIDLGENPNLILLDYVFANLTNLRSISLDRCQLKRIPEHAFENCSNLTILEIQDNELTYLPRNLFKTLKNLKELNLSKNKLVFIPEKLFSSLKNLQKLDLEDNNLTVITKNTFEGLTKLETLIIKKNYLSVIESHTFLHLSKLIKLDLSFNQWREKGDAVFTSIFFSLEQLEYLLLSHNKISSFLDGVLATLTHLKELDVSYNDINMINVSSFTKVSANNLKVDLSHNDISYIDFESAEIAVSENMKNSVQSKPFHKSNFTKTLMDVTFNPLTCDCNNFGLVKYLRHRMSYSVGTFVDIKVENMQCFGPKDFRHIQIKDLYPEDIICEFSNEDCPINCRCFNRPYDSAVVIDCAYKNLTQLPNISMIDVGIEINLTGNFLESGPSPGCGYEMVKNLFLSNNKISSFNWCPPNIEILTLDHNRLTTLDSKVLSSINKSAHFIKLSLANNSWSCGCSASDLQSFIITHFKKIKLSHVICHDNQPLAEKKLLCKSKLAIAAQIVIPMLTFFVIMAVVMALYFRYKLEMKIWMFSKNMCLRFVTEEELDKDKKFDVFLSFSHKDEEFVVKNLVPSLEKSFKLCIHSRDWIPGELINDQIVDSVYNSRRTLVVLSNNFLESTWGRLEFMMAHNQSLQEGRPRVIVMKLDNLNVDKITGDIEFYMKTKTYVEWGEPWFWKKLLYALPHGRSPSTHKKSANMSMTIVEKI